MKWFAFILTFLIATTAGAESPDKDGPHYDAGDSALPLSGGILLGPQAWCEIDLTDDDTTPEIGTLAGCGVDTGGNILFTATGHGAGVSITRFDGADVLNGMILWVIGQPATNQTTIADGGNFWLDGIDWDSPASGDPSILELEAHAQAGTITKFADATGGQVTVTSTHNLKEDQTVVITGTTSYNGTFTATNVVGTTTFEITDTWVADDATGAWTATLFYELGRSGQVDDFFAVDIYLTGDEYLNGGGTIQSPDLATAVATGSVNLETGAQGAAGDYDSGDLELGTGISTTAGDSGSAGVYSGDAADTSGAVATYSGDAAGEGSGTAKLYSGASAGSAASGAVSVYSGDQTAAGDVGSGALAHSTGTTTTLGDSGPITRGTGNAADTSGDLTDSTGTSANTGEASGHMYRITGDQTHATGGASGGITDYTGTAAGTAASGGLLSYTGAQTNSGDYDSGSVTHCRTGATTTDGDTGDCIAQTGVAGAGSGDAGSHIFQTHGANTRFTIAGDGSATFTGTIDAEDHVAIGDASSVSVADALIIDSDFSATTGSQLLVKGLITIDSGTSSAAAVIVDPDGITLNDGGPGVHAYLATMELREPNITATTGTVQVASTLRILDGPGEGTVANWALHVDTGDVQIDEDLNVGGNLDVTGYGAVGGGSSLAAGRTLVIDRDFSNAGSGEALSVTGSQITVTAGTGDILHTLMQPGATTFNTSPTIHGYAATLNILEPNIVLADGATVTNAATVRIVDAPTEGGTMNAALWVDSGLTKLDGALTVDGLTTLGGGLVMGGDLDFAGNDGKNLDDLWADPVATDAAPRVTVLGTQPIFVEPAATNVTGANLVLAPSPGERTLDDVTLAGTTGDTLTFDVYSNGVVTQTVKTEGVDWDCDGAGTDIICVCNLYDLLVGAGAITGVTVTRTDGTCSDEKLTFTIDPGVSEYLTVVTSDDTNLDMTAGVDGVVQMAQGVRLTLDKDLDTYIVSTNDDTIGFYTSGILQSQMTTTNFHILDNYFTGTAGTRQAFIADGQTQFCNAAETNCYTFGASAPNTATLWDKAGTGAGIFNIGGGDFQFGGNANYYIDGATGQINIGGTRVRIYQTGDNSTAGTAMLAITSSAAAEMTADGNGEVQYGVHVTPELAMTNASAFVGWEHDPDITTQGTAQNYHYRLDWANDGVYEQKVQDDGDLILHEDPGSDTPALDGRIFAANAYTQASAGAASNGANVHVAAGIRLLKLQCDDPTKTNIDTVVFTVNDVAQAALVESTDFDCFGETADDCCINLAAAIVTAAYGITPDAATLAGTAYLTPDEDLLTVDSIVIADGEADGVGISLVEGTDGVLLVPEFVVLGAAAVTGTPALSRHGANLLASDADGVGRVDMEAQNFQANGNVLASGYVRAGAASYIGHTGLTRWTSSADGIWEMGINSGGQGWRVDVATLDGTASLYDEAGGALSLTLGGDITLGELLYLDDDGDSYITGTTTDDVITLFVNETAGTGYVEIIDSENAGHLAVGRTTATAPSRLSIVDGGADNEAGELVLYDDGGTGHFLWVNTADVLRAHNTAPADDDAAGYALMDLSTGMIGAAAQDGTFDDVILADGGVVGIPGNETIVFDAAGTITISGADLAHNEAVTSDAKLTTTDALDNLIASVTLADGEVLTVEATILGRERDGSDRNVYHVQGLFYRQGGGAVQQGVSTYIFEVESDVDWCGDLAVNGNDVQITVDGNGDTVDWEVTYTYQILVSAA